MVKNSTLVAAVSSRCLLSAAGADRRAAARRIRSLDGVGLALPQRVEDGGLLRLVAVAAEAIAVADLAAVEAHGGAGHRRFAEVERPPPPPVRPRTITSPVSGPRTRWRRACPAPGAPEFAQAALGGVARPSTPSPRLCPLRADWTVHSFACSNLSSLLYKHMTLPLLYAFRMNLHDNVEPPCRGARSAGWRCGARSPTPSGLDIVGGKLNEGDKPRWRAAAGRTLRRQSPHGAPRARGADGGGRGCGPSTGQRHLRRRSAAAAAYRVGKRTRFNEGLAGQDAGAQPASCCRSRIERASARSAEALAVKPGARLIRLETVSLRRWTVAEPAARAKLPEARLPGLSPRSTCRSRCRSPRRSSTTASRTIRAPSPASRPATPPPRRRRPSSSPPGLGSAGVGRRGRSTMEGVLHPRHAHALPGGSDGAGGSADELHAKLEA